MDRLIGRNFLTRKPFFRKYPIKFDLGVRRKVVSENKRIAEAIEAKDAIIWRATMFIVVNGIIVFLNEKTSKWYAQGESNPCLRRERALS